MTKKKSGEESASSDALKSLFSSDNPFRRKPESPPAPPSPVVVSSDASDKRRKREGSSDENPNTESAPGSSSKKRKEVFDAEATAPEKQRPKRKREELEREYERRLLGAGEEKFREENRGTEGAGKAKRKLEDVVREKIAVSKEPVYDDESKLLRTVFVGNVPLRTKRKTLAKEFSKFGTVESVRIRSVPLIDSKVPRKGSIIKGNLNEAVDRVHAYVVFEKEQSAHSALSHNMTEVGGNHIRVDMACPPRKKLKMEGPLYDMKRTVFVGNLPFDVKDEELYNLFCTSSPVVSSIEAIRVIRDPNTSLGKGIAYVLFKTRDAADSFVRIKDLMLRDRLLRLSHAKPENKLPSKRKEDMDKQVVPRKKPAFSLSNASYKDANKVKGKSISQSYQGLRASKSGVFKKSGLHATSNRREADHKRGGQELTIPKAKRPAVAARKERLKKRKKESVTPESARRNKKQRS